MFETTLKAIAAIRHPHTAYLLDGGNDPALRALCDRLGILHVDCRDVPGAKGGKINHCLTNFATGEFVLILDPDHIPEPDFLDRVLPCFEDEKTGFVQVVQAYHNAGENWVSAAAAEQTYGFYGPLMMGLGGMGVPVAIGANCTFRRKALDSIGGHAVALAEDAATAMRLHAAGWKSAYLPYRASRGLVPTGLKPYFHQQLKWAAGMFQLFLREYFRLFPRLGFPARLNYLFSGTHYLTGFATMLSLILPVAFLFGKVYAVEMPFSGFIFHLLPYLLFSTWITFFVQRWYSADSEKGFPWKSMFLEKGTWFVYTLALFYTLVGRRVPYLPTSKKPGAEGGLYLALPHLAAILLSAAAVAFAWLTYPRIDDGTRLMTFFAVLNIAMLTPVTFLCLRGARPAPAQASGVDEGGRR
jgi:cellulose synthase (UDP-forming)